LIKSESIANLVPALIAAKAKFGTIVRENENPGFKRGNKVSKYADLATVINATEPALLENGLVLSQFPVNTDTRVGVLSILMHKSGEFIGKEFTLPIIKQDAQTGVAGITYARRTSWKGVLGVAEEDDDGNKAAGREVGDEPREPYGRPAPEPEHSQYDPAAEPPTGAASPSLSLPANTGPKPDDKQLEEYGKKIRALGTKLSEEGNLRASRGMPINRKVLNYLLFTTSAADAKQVSVAQFDTFFEFAEKLAPAMLTKLIENQLKGEK